MNGFDIDKIFILMAIFQVKHFLADFPLQTKYMLRKSEAGWDFVPPLLAHCLVHGALTLVILLFFAPQLWWVAAVDFSLHFMMDRLKSGPRYLGRIKNKTGTPYWTIFGFDQMFHHLTDLFVVWLIVTYS